MNKLHILVSFTPTIRGFAHYYYHIIEKLSIHHEVFYTFGGFDTHVHERRLDLPTAFSGFDIHEQNQVHNNICIDMCEGLACVLGDLSCWVQILI